MRKTIVCSILFASLSSSPAYSDIDTLWARHYDLGSAGRLQACAEIQSGGFAAVGYYTDSNDENALVIKINPLGDTAWVRTFGTPNWNERLFDVTQLSDDVIAVCGFAAGGLNTMVAGYNLTGEQVWYQEFSSQNGPTQAAAVLSSQNSGFYLLARKYIENNDVDFWLLRCAANGDSIWSQTYGTANTDIPEDLLFDSNYHIKLFGSARNQQNNQYDFYHLSVDTFGNEMSSAVIGDTLWESMGSVARQTDGTYILAGECRQGITRNGFTVKMGSEGNVDWATRFTAGGLIEKFSGVAPSLSGGILLAGWTGTSINSPQLWILSVNQEGDTAWSWTGDHIGWAFEDLIELSDGGHLACGRANESSYDQPLVWRFSPASGIIGVVRDRVSNEPVSGVIVRAEGVPQQAISNELGEFTMRLGTGTYNVFTGGSCVTGDTLFNVEIAENQFTETDITAGIPQMIIEQTTVNVIAQNHIPGSTTLPIISSGTGDLLYSFESVPTIPPTNWLSVIPGQGRVTSGDTLFAEVQVLADTLDNGSFEYFGYIHIHSNSCPDTLRIIQVIALILDAGNVPSVENFTFYPAYPNPFNNSTTLQFSLDRTANVTLTAFDLQGRRVFTLLSEQLPMGFHEVSWNPVNLSSGLYFVRLEDALRSQTQRLLLLR